MTDKLKPHEIDERLIRKIFSTIGIVSLGLQAACAHPRPTISLTPEALVPPAGLVTLPSPNTPKPTEKSTETPTPTPIELVSAEFWEALKVKRGDWSKYIQWDVRYKQWMIKYAVDGTAVHDVPIPGLEGVVADLAVRAYYYDANGNKQTILVAMVIRLPDGTLVKTSSLNRIRSQAEIDQIMKDYPGSFQIGEPGSLPGVYFMTEENFIKMCGEECAAFPGVQAYLQFVKVNQTALDEFLKTGSPTLKIMLPAGQISSGGANIFPSSTPTP